jgi:hypothetical protein
VRCREVEVERREEVEGHIWEVRGGGYEPGMAVRMTASERKTNVYCMLCAVWGMLYAVYCVLCAVWGMLYAVCCMLYAVWGMLYAVCYMLYAVCCMPC